MAFADELRVYLEMVDGSPSVHRRIDAGMLKQHLIERLKAAESRWAPPVIEDLYRTWEPEVAAFARYIERLPMRDAPVTSDDAARFARTALDVAIGHRLERPADMTLVEMLELERVARAYRAVSAGFEPYALEAGFTVLRGPTGPVALTSVARVFLRLRGKDAIRWILTLETLQSHGPDDRWRIAPALLRTASKGGIGRWLDMDGDERFQFAKLSLDRGYALGILVATSNGDEVTGYQIADELQDVVTAVLEPGPWHTVIRALLDDERAALLPGGILTTVATDATVAQARMFAHEARNKLVPARFFLDAAAASAAESARANIFDARRNVVQLLDFVDQLLVTGELVTEQFVDGSLREILHEAISHCEDAERIELDGAQAVDVRIRAPRSRLVLAIANVIRNGVQATAGRVRVQWSVGEQMVRLDVDDDGPGVPDGDLRRIFDDGFTTRPDGRGFGLAYARKTIEETLRGRIWCERSQLGGARFSIALPTEIAS